MHFDSKFWQRAFLAFTTALFLSCAARVSQNDMGSNAPAAFNQR